MAGKSIYDAYVEVTIDDTKLKNQLTALNTQLKNITAPKLDKKPVDEFNKSITDVKKNLGGLEQSKSSIDKTKKSVDSLNESGKRIGDTKSHVNNTGKAAKDMDKSFFGANSSAKNLLVTMGGFSAALAFKQLISITREFQSNMGVLRVSLGATKDEMALLDAQSIRLGADVKLPGTSAGDAAAAMTELAKAGLSVKDTLGASRGVLQLSAAGQIANAQAAQITANALNAFNLEGKEATRVADLLSGAANSSSASVEGIALGFQQAASAFSIAGFQVDELATSIALLSNQGIKGSDAGTSLKTFIARIAAPSAKAKTAIDELGLSFFDAQGNFLSMSQIAQNLQVAFKDLTAEQKTQALVTIFGNDSSRAAAVLAKEGAKGFDELALKVNKQGSASELAAAQNEGLGGIIDGVKSTVETFALSIGKSAFPAFAPMLKQISAGATEAAAVLGPVLGASFSIVGKGLAGVTPLLGIALALLKPLVPVVETFAEVLNLIPTPVIAIVVALRLANMALDKFGAKGTTAGVKATGEATKAAGDNASRTSRFFSGLTTQLKATTDNANVFSRSMSTFTRGNQTALVQSGLAYKKFSGETITRMQAVRANISAFGTGATTAFRTAAAGAAGFGSNLLAALGGPVGIALIAATIAITKIMSAMSASKQSAAEMKKEVGELAKTLQFDTSSTTGVDRVTLALNRMEEAGGRGADSIKQIKEQLSQGQFSALIADTDAYDEKIKELTTSINKKNVAETNSFTRQGTRAANDYLNVATVGLKPLAESITGRDMLKGWQKKDPDKELRDALKRVRDELVKTEAQALKTKANLAKDLGLDKEVASFNKAAEALKKNKDVGKAYLDTLDATRKLTAAQAAQNAEATKVGVGYKTTADGAKLTAEATDAATESANKYAEAVAKVTANLGSVSAKFALESLDKKTFAALATQLETMDPSKIPDFGVELAQKMGVPADEAEKVLEGLSEFREQFNKEYQDMIADFKGKLPSLDSFFADKFEFKLGGPTLATLKTNSDKTRQVITEFQADLTTLIQNGQGVLAAQLASQGPQAAGTAADQASKLVTNTIDPKTKQTIKDSSAKTLAELNGSFSSYTSAVTAYGMELGPAAAAALGQEYNIKPDVLINPSFGVVIDTVEKQAIADQITAAETEIASLVETKRKTSNTGAKRELTNDIAAKTKEIDGLKTKLAEISNGAFTELTKQSANASTKIQSSMKEANIDGEIKKQSKKAGDEIKLIPTFIKDMKPDAKKEMKDIFVVDDGIKKQMANFKKGIEDGLSGVNATVNIKTASRARAVGGPISPGVPYLVGERGPEMIVPAGVGTVMTANKTSNMLSNTTVKEGDKFYVNVNGVSLDQAVAEFEAKVRAARRQVV